MFSVLAVMSDRVFYVCRIHWKRTGHSALVRLSASLGHDFPGGCEIIIFIAKYISHRGKLNFLCLIPIL